MTDLGDALVLGRELFIWERPDDRSPSSCATQALCGCHVEVLEDQGLSLKVRMPDTYEGWADSAGLRRLNHVEWARWRGQEMAVVKVRESWVIEEEGVRWTYQSLGYGTVLPLLGEERDRWVVKMPDGNAGRLLKRDAAVGADEAGWVGSKRGSIADILRDAEVLKSVAYTWGGTSSLTGFDCSGFIQALFRVHGISLPRDAQQQAEAGRSVKREEIQAGDLVFFKGGEKKERSISHVGLALGKDLFVDAGSYWPTSLDPKSPFYSQKRAENFVEARRIL